MKDNFLIVDKCILPDYFEKVLDARHFLENGSAKDISQAVKMAGISRSTYYKYKDYIYEPFEMTEGRKAVITAMLTHEQGILSALLNQVSEAGCSVLTITQSLPIHNKAGVTLSIDISGMATPIEKLIENLEKTPGIEKPRLLAIE